MEKLLQFPTKTDRGVFLYLLDDDCEHLTKTAAEYHSEIAAYINNPKSIPGKTQVLLTALGAYEYWGSNVNGDSFSEADLEYDGPEYGHKTFQTTAKVYKHHQNKYGKDPHYGDVVLAVYNKKYHRVELIIAVDNVAGKEIVDRVNSGDWPDWSMGCRVKYDICSNCGNKAKTRKEYCRCLKFYLNRIHPETGKHVHAINPRPNFFDISYVLIGADRTSKTHMKVANLLGHIAAAVSSAELGELFYNKSASDKTAEMEKEIPADPGVSSPDTEQTLQGIMELKAREKALPPDQLNSLATKFPIQKILSTMMMMGIVPKPEETQRMVIVAAGKPELADKLDSKGLCFDPDEEIECPSNAFSGIGRSGFSPEIMQKLTPHMEDRSAYNPFITKRILLMIQSMPEPKTPTRFIKLGGIFNNDKFNPPNKEKPSSVMSAAKYMALAALLHQAFAKKAPMENLEGLDKLLGAHPGLMMAIGLGGAATLNQILSPGRPRGQEHGSFAMQGEIPSRMKVAFSLAGRESKKLLGGTAGAYLLSSGLQKRYQSDPEYREGSVKKFFRKNPDIASGLVAFDALTGLSGGGTTGLYRKAKTMANPVLKRFTKMAEDQNLSIEKQASDKSTNSTADRLSSSLVWPLAFGRIGAPTRVIGSLVDQGLIAGAGKLRKALSKTPDKNKLN